jgi:HKD family nuclease
MNLIVQSPTRPERIISALEDMIEDNTSEIRLAVAYVMLSGTELLVDRLQSKLGSAKWSKVKKSLITCFDFGFTEPKALQKWISLPNSAAFAQNADLVSASSLNPKTAFHVKMYDFRTAAHANLMIGSANLSERALVFNSEAVTVHKGILTLNPLNAAWSKLSLNAAKVDAALITAYSAQRTKYPPPPSPPIPSTSSTPTQTLWEAIEAGTSSPERDEFFWVEAGFMGGGAENQLELPRGANRYFRFHFTDYHLAHAKFGKVDLSVGAQFHSDRSLSWHGDNRMERIYLPTGVNYSNTVLLFRRRKTLFELTWTPVGSERAVVWANASDAAGRRYKVGVRGTRLCGLF